VEIVNDFVDLAYRFFEEVAAFFLDFLPRPGTFTPRVPPVLKTRQATSTMYLT